MNLYWILALIRGVWSKNRGGEDKIGVQQIKYKTSQKSDNKNAKGVVVSKYGVQQVTSEEQWCLQAIKPKTKMQSKGSGNSMQGVYKRNGNNTQNRGARLKAGCAKQRCLNPISAQMKEMWNPNKLNLTAAPFLLQCLEPPSHQDSSRRCHCRKFHGRRDAPPSTPATIGVVASEKLRESLLFLVFRPACEIGSLLLPEDAIDATPVTTTVSTSAAVNGVCRRWCQGSRTMPFIVSSPARDELGYRVTPSHITPVTPRLGPLLSKTPTRQRRGFYLTHFTVFRFQFVLGYDDEFGCFATPVVMNDGVGGRWRWW